MGKNLIIVMFIEQLNRKEKEKTDKAKVQFSEENNTIITL